MPLAGFGVWRLSSDRDFRFFGGLASAVDTTEKAVASTFDDGPHPAGTAELLAVPAEKDVSATFYLIGRDLEAHSDLGRDTERGYRFVTVSELLTLRPAR